jgi:hypothetical protein
MSARRFGLTAFPYAVFLLLTALSWQRWIEPYVDTGRELMVPWRMAQGESLYREVRFFHGPLAPAISAAIDAVFGRHLLSRTLFAALISLVHLEGLRRLAGRFLSAGRASLVTGAIVGTTWFLRPGGQLFPFSFDTSMAVAAQTWALFLAAGRGAGNRDRIAAAALAVSLLCRPEMGIATVLVLAWDAGWSRRLLALAALPLAVAAPVYAALSAGTSLESLRREGWLAIVGPPEAFRNVYAAYAGFDRPSLRLAELALVAVILALFVAYVVAAAFFSRSLGGGRAGSFIEAGALTLLAGAAAVALRPPGALADTLELIPPLVRFVPILAVSLALLRGVRRLLRRDSGDLVGAVPDAVLFSAALCGLRLLLAAGYVGPYNAFLLPLPLLSVAILLFAAADRVTGAVGPALPRLLAGALVVFLGFRIAAQALLYRHPAWSRVETPAGSLFLLEPVAGTTRLVVNDLAARLPHGGSVTGFPEGGFLDYVLGLSNPLPQEQFFPGHLDRALETETMRRLERRPPDAVLLCNVVAVGHGSRSFGSDYLVRLGAFLQERFALAASYGPGAGAQARIGDPQFFVTIRIPRRDLACGR